MIFITLGSREYQFDRLLIKIDELIEANVITDEVFAQIGQSPYTPKHYKFERYLSKTDFQAKQGEADLIISHGGTGALVSALKMGKQVIAVPRLAEYNEHIDDHQLQVTDALRKKGFLLAVLDMDELGNAINSLKRDPIKKPFKIESRVKDTIITFIEANR